MSSPGEGEAYWVHAYPEGNKLLFALVKMPSDLAKGWADARLYGKAEPEWVHIPYTTFREAIQSLQTEVLGGRLDSVLEHDEQRLVYDRLRAIFRDQTSKIRVEPRDSQPQSARTRAILEKFGLTDKSPP